jgi:hypothetical protein
MEFLFVIKNETKLHQKSSLETGNKRRVARRIPQIENLQVMSITNAH